MEKSKVCVLIPARYNSSRLEGKPLLKIGDKTIIERTYTQTKKAKLVDRIWVVSDDDRIINHVKSFGGEVLKMDLECPNGTVRIARVLDKIPKKYNIIVNVQGDEPFIDPDHLDFIINKSLEDQEDEQVVCSTIHSEIINKNDYNNRGIGKMVLDVNNNVLYASRALIPHTKTGNSLQNHKYYAHIGIFVFRRSYLPKFLEHPDTPAQISEDIEWLKILEMGYKIKSYEVPNYEIGVNTLDDFNYLSNKYLGVI